MHGLDSQDELNKKAAAVAAQYGTTVGTSNANLMNPQEIRWVLKRSTGGGGEGVRAENMWGSAVSWCVLGWMGAAAVGAHVRLPPACLPACLPQGRLGAQGMPVGSTR